MCAVYLSRNFTRCVSIRRAGGLDWIEFWLGWAGLCCDSVVYVYISEEGEDASLVSYLVFVTVWWREGCYGLN